MRTKQLIDVCGVGMTQFKNLKRRHQVPFASFAGHGEKPGPSWSEYSFLDAVALKVSIDLMKNDGLGGLAASSTAANGMCRIRDEGYTEVRLIDTLSEDCWIAWAVRPFEHNGKIIHGSTIVAGSLLGVAAKIAVGDATYSRVVLANVSRAAREVVSRGVELGVKECLALEKALKEAA